MHDDAISQKLKGAQIFLGVGMVKNRSGQSGHWTLKLIFYLNNELIQLTDFLQAFTNSLKLKCNWKFFWVGMVKNGCGQSDNRTLKFTISEEWAGRINWFLAWWYRFTKIKSRSKIFLSSHDKKWVLPVWSSGSKIDCISEVNRWNKPIFYMLVEIQES